MTNKILLRLSGNGYQDNVSELVRDYGGVIVRYDSFPQNEWYAEIELTVHEAKAWRLWNTSLSRGPYCSYDYPKFYINECKRPFVRGVDDGWVFEDLLDLMEVEDGRVYA